MRNELKTLRRVPLMNTTATRKQQDLIETLAVDMLYTTRLIRNDRISRIVGRPITWLDQLSVGEADMVIKEWIGKLESEKRVRINSLDPFEL